MIKIEKSVPLPKKSNHKKYPFMDMEIGDSFFAYIEHPGNKKEVRKLQSSILASNTSKRTKGRKFITKTYGAGVRCWRVK